MYMVIVMWVELLSGQQSNMDANDAEFLHKKEEKKRVFKIDKIGLPVQIYETNLYRPLGFQR